MPLFYIKCNTDQQVASNCNVYQGHCLLGWTTIYKLEVIVLVGDDIRDAWIGSCRRLYTD